MQLVRYTLCDIDLMMVDIEGTLYCSTPQLEKVFRVSQSHLGNIARKWRQGEFSDTRLGSVVDMNHISKETLSALDIKRARLDSRLWSEDDVLGFAFALRSDIARHCRSEFKDILKRHARREMVPREQLDKMMMTCSDLTEQVGQLWDAVQDLQKQSETPRPERDLHLVKG